MKKGMIPEYFDASPPVDVNDAEFKRLLGYPGGHEFEGRALELSQEVRSWYARNGKPWVYARPARTLAVKDSAIIIDGISFTSKRIVELFSAAKAESAMIVAVSAGIECEERARRLWKEQKPDEYFFTEVYGSAVVEHLIMRAGFRLCESADAHHVAVLPHYSPGYPEWDIADQPKLWKVIAHGAPKEVSARMSVLDSGMLRPKKSLLALFGVTSHVASIRHLTNVVPCETCSLQKCTYRRAPYRHFLPEIDNVRDLQPRAESSAPAVKYSVASKVLEKWSTERLRIEEKRGDSIEARFRYEGSTCSNMGMPLVFDFTVMLKRSGGNYIIEEAHCGSAPGETGYEAMCDYIERGDEFMETIATEAPLRGKPLTDVFSWQRAYNPSTCFCASAGREHKWGLVYEVIHFALSRRDGK